MEKTSIKGSKFKHKEKLINHLPTNKEDRKHFGLAKHKNKTKRQTNEKRITKLENIFSKYIKDKELISQMNESTL